MTSPYLNRPLRSYQDAVQDHESRRDHQPDLKFGHDALQWGEHRAIATGHTIRREVRRVVEAMKARNKLPGPASVAEYEKDMQDLDWLRCAREAHSKAILDREAYRQAINEREIQRELGLMP